MYPLITYINDVIIMRIKILDSYKLQNSKNSFDSTTNQ